MNILFPHKPSGLPIICAANLVSSFPQRQSFPPSCPSCQTMPAKKLNLEKFLISTKLRDVSPSHTWNILFSNLSPSLNVSSEAALVDSLAIATAICNNIIRIVSLSNISCWLFLTNLWKSCNMVGSLDRLLHKIFNREDFGDQPVRSRLRCGDRATWLCFRWSSTWQCQWRKVTRSIYFSDLRDRDTTPVHFWHLHHPFSLPLSLYDHLHDHHQEDQPVRFISIARDFPIALVSLWVPPPPGMVPDVRDYLYDGVGDYDDDGDASSTMLVTGDSSSG